MKTITQEFQEINHLITHSTNKNALTPLETRLHKLKNEYLRDNRMSRKVKSIVIRNYKISMKLINKMKKRLK